MLFLGQGTTDVVPGDEHDAGDGPQLHEHNPHPVLEGALMMVPDPHPQGCPSLLPGIIHQGSWHNVPDPSPCIAPCYANQELQAVGRHGHAGGGNRGQQGEHHGLVQ